MDPLVGIISFVPRSDIVSCFFVIFFIVSRCCHRGARVIYSPFLGKTTPVRVTISWVT